ncbi:MAG: inorganic phosphate transporter [Candidatus Sericytochromatia bacterium]|nr:inorganic phosphate transporter [Candidatus Sericytochromatia bacterium]
MHELFVLLVLVIIASLIFDYINGFHDTANSIATVVSTRVLRPSQAVMMAAVLNLVGAFLGVEVAKTIGKGIVDTGSITQLTVLSALIGGIIWNLITWYYGIPSSSSHAIIGGLCGSSAAYGGLSVIKMNGLVQKVFLPMIISPILGITIGFFFMLSLYWLLAKQKPGVVNRRFSKLQLLSAGLMSLSHGSNDAQKTMGIITMALISYTVFSVSNSDASKLHDSRYASIAPITHISKEKRTEIISKFINEGGVIKNDHSIYQAFKKIDEKGSIEDNNLVRIEELDPVTVRDIQLSLANKELKADTRREIKFQVPAWVIFACAIAMAMGTLAGGWKIIHTLGSKMIKLQPIHGFAAETSAAIMILSASHFGMPVSTTHIISTSIMGVGASKRFSAVKWGIVKNIVVAWILTFPVSFGIGWISYHILNLFF